MLTPGNMEQLFELLIDRRGINLREHKGESLRRRLAEVTTRFGATPAEFLSRLEREPAELDRLLRELLVPFTEFFRDTEVFEDLRSAVLPALAPNPYLSVWAAGVASGEEAWSVAMLLAESRAEGSYRVLGTDVQPELVRAARLGRYPRSSTEQLPAAFLERYFAQDGDELRVGDRLSEKVTFAVHDLVGARLSPVEAVVASFQVVLCRNVLLYLEPRLRLKALERLAGTLERGGALVLGSAELIPAQLGSSFKAFPGTRPSSRIFIRAGGPLG